MIIVIFVVMLAAVLCGTVATCKRSNYALRPNLRCQRPRSVTPLPEPTSVRRALQLFLKGKRGISLFLPFFSPLKIQSLSPLPQTNTHTHTHIHAHTHPSPGLTYHWRTSYDENPIACVRSDMLLACPANQTSCDTTTCEASSNPGYHQQGDVHTRAKTDTRRSAGGGGDVHRA